VGIDVNPVATLIAKVRTTPPTERLSDVARQVAKTAREREPQVPEIPRLDHWFQSSVQRALAQLVATVDEHVDSVTRDALRVAISRIVVRVSNQESDTRYAAVSKNVSYDDVFSLFIKAAESLSQALEATFNTLLPLGPAPRILTRDVLEVQPEEIRREIGLVVTSPPYPNAYEYWLYHKYRMFWLGMDPLAVREAEIGARPHYFRKNPATEGDFERQLKQCFALLAQVMVSGGHACFLVGRSIIHGRVVDNATILKRAAAAQGFIIAGVASREIRRARKSFNPANSAIERESLLVFLRP
jgi:site-specific DNA-methyltransferase (cytosine-N4-specific)